MPGSVNRALSALACASDFFAVRRATAGLRLADGAEDGVLMRDPFVEVAAWLKCSSGRRRCKGQGVAGTRHRPRVPGAHTTDALRLVLRVVMNTGLGRLTTRLPGRDPSLLPRAALEQVAEDERKQRKGHARHQNKHQQSDRSGE